MPPSKDWIQTYTGRAFCPLEPDPTEIDIRDIAHALSMNCRFNGHCHRFYSVADHCVRVSEIVDPEFALWGLLHDAAEAYITDLPRPLKRRMPLFSEVEDQLLQVIIGHFGLPWISPMPEAVKLADEQMLATEARDLMSTPPEDWGLNAEPLEITIEPRTPEQAERAFLDRFDQLKALR